MPVQLQSSVVTAELPRLLWPALSRGFRRLCPQCGLGRIFSGFTKVNRTCAHCGLELHLQRADDAPPYFTILITGHLIVASMLLTEQFFSPPEWVQMSLWVPMTILVALWLLPRVKGALIGFQWARSMHGFGGHFDE